MSLKSYFAILDVKAGRHELAKRIRNGEQVPVEIRGVICNIGKDDGISTEFTLDVTEVKELEPK
jgi:hypothetical protein